jgi:hypothetical protein
MVKHELEYFWKLRCFFLVEDLNQNVCRNMKKTMKSLNIRAILTGASSWNVQEKVQIIAAKPFSVEMKTKETVN